ncbi:RING [Seminavis robusta]|uniref:RING n=1 Tax=Seminavis robusta TaxID=568900 RepID=A0A9N8H2K9_9STRA|nr:RING [Seminavis robusta]|eukprot:Sro38_g023910.1 RING (405) ;mRNA; r:146996-148293
MFHHNAALESLMRHQQRPIFPAPPSMHQNAPNLSNNQGAAPSSSLYSGKWTLEEETYVSFLCEEFRAGSLAVPEGKSLRCFLADQLGCNAKRISKKYERTGYNGKLQYIDRRRTMTPQDLKKCNEKMQVLEQKFRESRETLKLVENSRKRTVPSVTPNPPVFHSDAVTAALSAYLQPAAKRARTAASMILTNPAPIHLGHIAAPNPSPAGAAGVAASPSLAALSLPVGRIAVGATTVDILGCSIQGLSNNVMDPSSSLLFRRSALAQANSDKSERIRASMISTLQKYRDPSTGFMSLAGPDPPAAMANNNGLPCITNNHEGATNGTRLERLSSVAAILEEAQRQTCITSLSNPSSSQQTVAGAASNNEDALLDAEVAASATSPSVARLFALRLAYNTTSAPTAN